MAPPQPDGCVGSSSAGKRTSSPRHGGGCGECVRAQWYTMRKQCGEALPPMRTANQGLTLVHFLGSRKRFLWNSGCI